MIIPDVNILIYAHEEISTHHQAARDWWVSVLEGSEEVGIPWVVISAFYRILSASEKRINPIPRDLLIAAISRWLECDNVVILNPNAEFFALFSRLLVNCQVLGKFTSDAFLAGLAIENGATFATNDKGFSRFESEGLRWFNPLAEEKPRKKSKNKR